MLAWRDFYRYRRLLNDANDAEQCWQQPRWRHSKEPTLTSAHIAKARWLRRCIGCHGIHGGMSQANCEHKPSKPIASTQDLPSESKQVGSGTQFRATPLIAVFFIVFCRWFVLWCIQQRVPSFSLNFVQWLKFQLISASQLCSTTVNGEVTIHKCKPSFITSLPTWTTNCDMVHQSSNSSRGTPK